MSMTSFAFEDNTCLTKQCPTVSNELRSSLIQQYSLTRFGESLGCCNQSLSIKSMRSFSVSTVRRLLQQMVQFQCACLKTSSSGSRLTKFVWNCEQKYSTYVRMPRPIRSNDLTRQAGCLAKQLQRICHIRLLITSKSEPRLSPSRITWLNQFSGSLHSRKPESIVSCLDSMILSLLSCASVDSVALF